MPRLGFRAWHFPSCFADAIVNQLLKCGYVYFGWKILPLPLQQAAREALKVTDKQRVIAMSYVVFLVAAPPERLPSCSKPLKYELWLPKVK